MDRSSASRRARRRALSPPLASLLLLCSLLSSAGCASSPAPKTVGILTFVSLHDPAVDALSARLEDLGRSRGWQIEFELRSAEGVVDRLPDLALELLAERVDVLVAVTTPSALAAYEVAKPKNVPVVFALVSDPVGAGLVESFDAPHPLLTGVMDVGALLAERRLEHLLRAAPDAKRVLVPVSDTVVSSSIYARLEHAARVLDVELVAFPVSSTKELETMYANMEAGSVDALYIASDNVTSGADAARFEFLKRESIPAIGGGRYLEGAVLGFGTSFEAIGEQAAVLVAKVLAGIHASELPLERSRNPKLRLFLETAREIGFVPSENTLLSADEILGL